MQGDLGRDLLGFLSKIAYKRKRCSGRRRCPGNGFYSGALLALPTVWVRGVSLPTDKPRFYPTVDFALECPKAFLADVYVSAIRLSVRLVGPHPANGKANRPVITRHYFDRLVVPARIALLAERQSTFLSKMPRNASPRFEWFQFTHTRRASARLLHDGHLWIVREPLGMHAMGNYRAW